LVLFIFFYYGGGDTVNFYRDAYPMWQAFFDSPILGLRTVFISMGDFSPDLYPYMSRVYFYSAGDSDTFNVIRVAAFFSWFTFYTYSCIGLCFAWLSFTGMWKMYRVFYDMYPKLHRPLAWAVFFIPSVYFWGSGVMKDSICMGALGWLFYGFYFGLVKRKKFYINILIIVASMLVLYVYKRYILFSFFPAMFLWLFLQYRANIKNKFLKAVAFPVVLAIGLPVTFVILTRITQGDTKYSLENLGNTAKVSADWLKTVSTREQGSVYSLGELDGSLASTLRVAPQAVWLGLFQPYLWQARNPVMALSAFEATFFLLITLRILWESGFLGVYRVLLDHPITFFCLVVAVLLAFGSAIASSNYGTLVRYRIPMMPFYLGMLYILRYQTKGSVKLF
jgi:hypothetical protein